MRDLVNLRKRREKHFKNDDGTFFVQLYNEDIHYKKDSKFYDVDNTILEKEDCYINDTNNQTTIFYKDSDFLYEINFDDLYLKFSLEDSLKKRVCVEDNSIYYSDILSNIDINYVIRNNKIKENIILKNRNIPNQLVFDIYTNCNLVKVGNKINVYDKDKLISSIESPFFVDNNRSLNDNVNFSLEYKDDKYTYTISLTDEWLFDDDRSYPIVLDPTVVNRVGENVYDTFISSLNPTVNRNNSNILEVGTDDGDIRRTLLKFELPELDSSHNIINATAFMRAYNLCVNSVDNRAINVHELTSSWDEDTVTWNDINDKYNNKIETYFYPARHTVINSEEEAISEFDITNLVKKWYAGTDNNGVMLKWENEVESDDAFTYTSYSKFYDLINETGLRPYLVITYSKQNGIKDYMNYTDVVYLNGVTHINNFNGNITHSFDVNQIFSKLIPVTLKLINNSERSLNELDSFAYGWKFNIEEELSLETIDELNYIKYLDATNSLIYFTNNEGVFEDEDGLNYKITLNNGSYELLDKENNKKIFSLVNNVYKLVKVINNNGAYVDVLYNDSSRVTKIITSENKFLDFTYTDEKNIVTSEIFESIINLSNNEITSINSLEGDTNIFCNENHLINKVTDISGQYALFEYYSPTYRLKKVIQYGNDSTQGNSLEFFYEFNSTTVKDINNKCTVYTFDSVGRTISSLFYMNGLDDLKNTCGFTDKYVDSSNKKESSSSIIKYTNNLLSNSLFESDKDCNFSINNSYFDDTEGEVGNRALRLSTMNDISYQILEDDYYCISFSLKTDIMEGVNFNLIELYNGVETIIDNYSIEGECIDYEYKRYYLKGFCRNGSNLILRISQDDNVNSYIDCIQLEKSKVMNNHNMISNSSFENGLSYWDTSSFNLDTMEDLTNNIEIIDVNTSQKAVKIKSAPNVDNVLSQSFNISGKKGDVYNLSFMYKNEGIYETETGEIGCSANIRFWDDSDEGQGTWNFPLNIHSNTWQFFDEVIVAENDYESFDLNIMSLQEINNLYVTNVCLVRDVGAVKFRYDELGNLISATNMNGNESTISYDVNNQMVSTVDPKNMSFKYEYDNEKTSLIFSKISSSGLSESYVYSENGSLLKKTIKYVSFNIENDKDYYIRAKGTNKYFNVINNSLKVKDFECNKHVFKIETVDNNVYKLKYSKYYLSADDGDLDFVISPTSNCEFKLHKNNNGSFCFVLNSDNSKSLSILNDYIIVSDFNSDDYNQQFYFESVDNDLYIEEINTYDDNDMYLISSKDTLGKETYFEYDDKGNLISECEQDGRKYIYEYDELSRLTSKTSANNKKINYFYKNNELTNISSNDIDFKFEYDQFNRIKNTKVNDYLIMNNEYDNVTGNIIKITYGNNDKVEYSYDDFKNVKFISKSDDTFEFLYNDLNQLTEINSEAEKIKYIYDFANRLSRTAQNDFEIEFKYDDNGNVNRKDYRYGFINYNTEYQYNGDDLIDKVVTNDVFIENTYDYLARITNINVNDFYNIEYQFLSNGKKTSTLIKSMKIADDFYSFEYDDTFNIIGIKKNSILINKYVYNILNELIEDVDYVNNLRNIYYYDNNGNILKVEKIDFLNNEVSYDIYEYNNSTYKDLLTKFNDIDISYDASFNPIRIGDDILEWKNGTELSKYIKGENVYQYKYDVSGIRTSKNINGVETKYYLENNKVMLQDDGTNRLFFIRDEDGELIGFKLFDTTYIYKKNLQNDIIGIYDSNKNLIVNYSYDSYGNILSIKDNNNIEITNSNHVGLLNPFRFRSYYYDDETGLYYLNKRYYNPKFRRFLNLDAIISSSCTNLGINLFLYCNNNPVLHSDNSGLFTFWDALDIVSFVDSAYTMVKDPTWYNGLFLAADAVAAIMPFVPSASTANKIVDTATNIASVSKKNKNSKSSC